VLLILVTTFLASILLASIGLVVATASRARHWQVVLSVLLLLALVVATIIWSVFMLQLIGSGERASYETAEFWQVSAAIFSFYVSFVALFVLMAAGQLSFASDNRSTPVRVVLMIQQLLWIGWMSFLWLLTEEEEVLYVVVLIAAAYWFLAGAMLAGEHGELSPRVKRSLPQSFLGRVFWTWFNPGSATGYHFACANLLAIVLVAGALAIFGRMLAFRGVPNSFEFTGFLVLCPAYVVAYLGAGRLLILLLRRWIPLGVWLSVLLQLLLAAGGAVLPVLIQAWFQGYARLEYGPLQATNWAWTLEEEASTGVFRYPVVVVMVCLAAVAIFGLNLLSALGEVAHVRREKPARVVEDDRQTEVRGSPSL
jgi:hypothetical protein